jgi:hypothetical protein
MSAAGSGHCGRHLERSMSVNQLDKSCLFKRGKIPGASAGRTAPAVMH